MDGGWFAHQRSYQRRLVVVLHLPQVWIIPRFKERKFVFHVKLGRDFSFFCSYSFNTSCSNFVYFVCSYRPFSSYFLLTRMHGCLPFLLFLIPACICLPSQPGVLPVPRCDPDDAQNSRQCFRRLFSLLSLPALCSDTNGKEDPHTHIWKFASAFPSSWPVRSFLPSSYSLPLLN